MIDSSFMTTLPDSWAISKRFIMFPLNRWEDSYERVFLGGLTWRFRYYYYTILTTPVEFIASVQRYKRAHRFLFNTGDLRTRECIRTVWRGVHHCLLPQPKHISLIQKLKTENYNTRVFQRRAKPEDIFRIFWDINNWLIEF